MGDTTSRGYRFPSGSDAATIALYFKNLATDVDADVQGLAPIILQVQRTTGGLSIPDTTSTTITGFNTTNISVGSPVPSYSSGAFTIRAAGVYEAKLFVSWPTISAAHRTALTLLHNGALIPDGLDTKWYPSGTSWVTHHSVTAYAQCAVGDTISQQALQTSGTSQTIVDGSAVFSIRRIG